MRGAALPLLIDRARELRDQLAATARAAESAALQAQATCEQLERFRTDTLARSPTARPGGFSADHLHDFQRFLARLDEALQLQREECERRRAQATFRQQQLAEGQRRLLAFEALAERAQAELRRRQARQAQRESDEFAARARRLASSPLSSGPP